MATAEELIAQMRRWHDANAIEGGAASTWYGQAADTFAALLAQKEVTEKALAIAEQVIANNYIAKVAYDHQRAASGVSDTDTRKDEED